MAEPFIQLRDIRKSFGSHLVLDGVNLSIYEGEITAIIGKSGGGKSVLLKHVIGLIKPDSGEILVRGKPLREFTRDEWREFKRSLSYMFQSNALFDSMTVYENIALPLVERGGFTRKEIDGKVHSRLEQFELIDVEDKYPSQISGGMQKRVALARALVTEPKMILFDEPTTGLDPLRKNAVLNMIAHYQKAIGFTAVVVSHDIPDIFFISNRVAIIDNKRIPFQGTPVELEQSDNEIVWEFIHGQESLQDQLTGLCSWEELERDIKKALETVEDRGAPFCLLLLQVDSLEKIREQVGYIAAQRIFQCVGMALKDAIGPGKAARCETEGVLALLPGVNRDRAAMILQEIIADCNDSRIMDPSTYPKVCVDFEIKASVKEVDRRVRFQELISQLHDELNTVMKMECRPRGGRE